MVMAGMAVVAVMGTGEAGRVPVVAVSDRLAVAGLFFFALFGYAGRCFGLIWCQASLGGNVGGGGFSDGVGAVSGVLPVCFFGKERGMSGWSGWGVRVSVALAAVWLGAGVVSAQGVSGQDGALPDGAAQGVAVQDDGVSGGAVNGPVPGVVSGKVATLYADVPLQEVRARAESGEDAAELELGLRLLMGRDGVRDVPAGVSWISRAAEKGMPHAEYELGALYAMGVGVPCDAAKAAVWFRRAAIQGYAPAQSALGFAYENGSGVPRDAEKAAYWLEKAAASGNGIALEGVDDGL